MTSIDLTHLIHPDMPVFPGTETPVFEAGTSLEKNGFLEKKISFYSHTGTHMDAPAHILPEGKTLDEFPVSKFHGNALLIDVKETITLEFLKPNASKLKEVDFVVFRSGWDKYWGSKEYFKAFPTLTKEAAIFLCQFNLKGIGLDMISIDSVEDESLTIHHIILGKEMVIIENLCNLKNLPNQFKLFVLPLHVQKADGAPVRAIAYY